MKIIQTLFVKLMSALVLLLGLVLIFALFTGDFSLIDQAKAEYLSWPAFVQKMAWAATSIALIFIGGIGLLPVLQRRRRQVSFEGPHGDVFYDLDSVEKTIERVVGRMKEVKNIDAHVKPAEDHKRVEVSADVVLNPTGGSARNAATLVSQQIENAAEQMLGEEGVVKVVLRVKKILVDMKAPLVLAPPTPGTEAQQELHGIEEAEREAEAERHAAIAKAQRQADEERQAALARAARENAAAEAAVVGSVAAPIVAPDAGTDFEDEEEEEPVSAEELEDATPFTTHEPKPDLEQEAPFTYLPEDDDEGGKPGVVEEEVCLLP
ncbi:MAG: alkaline shock response membrane anchor protein AmaP, partial [FCB group bacterium]|nr:alkaline shock response membrane anchor protein AmaP [FCB group bacterium]